MAKRIRLNEAKRSWLKEYVIGLGLGGASAIYGVVAFWVRHAYLPGIKGGNNGVTGLHGAAAAAGYLAGGLYLVCRHFLHRRCRSASRRGQMCLIENVLLMVLIAAVVYVLWQVGTVG
ncbi:MAG: hypothetical protein ACYS8L_04920 [Planctomycetota bacterium]|jgi:hypothetical protein